MGILAKSIVFKVVDVIVFRSSGTRSDLLSYIYIDLIFSNHQSIYHSVLTIYFQKENAVEQFKSSSSDGFQSTVVSQ